MPRSAQDLIALPGKPFAFNVGIDANADGSITDLSNATATWELTLVPGGSPLVTKTGTLAKGGNGLWVASFSLTATDLGILPGVYYQDTTIANGGVSTLVSTGRLFLGTIMTGKIIRIGGRNFTNLEDVPPHEFDAPASIMVTVTPDPLNDLPSGCCRGLWASPGATANVVMFDGITELDNLPLATGWNPLIVSRVKAVGGGSGATVWAVY